VYITNQPMMTRLQMKNATATAAAAAAAAVPVPVPAPATLAAPAAIPNVPIVYPSMFDRWNLPL
jgi:hypothetical protein